MRPGEIHMKRDALRFPSYLKLLMVSALCGTGTQAGTPLSAVPGEYIVKFKNSVRAAGTAPGLVTKFSHLGLRFKRSLSHSMPFFLFKHDATENGAITTASISDRLDALRREPEVEYAEPNYIYSINMGAKQPAVVDPKPTPPVGPTVFPNDARFSRLWGMRNEGQLDIDDQKGFANADIHAANAWAISKGSRNVIVAIIDSGVDYTHPDLIHNMWSMPDQPDVHGYNAITNSLDPMDDNDHGTHVAGTIGAEGGNGQGVTGVNWKVSLMAIKFLNAKGSGSLSDAIKGIDWAREHGAHVMNNSWGGGAYSRALEECIGRARDAGILFVVAAGNTQGGHDNDREASYPANYNLDNIIAVAATNNQDKLSSFSHYGAKTVHIAAPGENIFSTFPNRAYATISGTSMASPHVAGAAALLLAKEPKLTYKQLRTRLLNNVDIIPSLKTKVSSGGRLNVYKALTNGN